MLSLYDKEPYFEIVDRLMKLTAKSNAVWGKMDVAQMLAHCAETFKIPLEKKKVHRNLIGYIFGGMAKKNYLNSKSLKRNLPTLSRFKITDERDFFIEKQNLMTVMARFYSGGPNHLGNLIHPFFGKLTGEEWGLGLYKHLDHHFSQFGV
jgi:hypothetical protein